MECPIKKSLDVIGGKWKLLIIHQFSTDAPIRFGELRKLIPDISEKVLMQELNSLVNNKILAKKSYPVVPPKVEYTITDRGKAVSPIITELQKFGATYME